MENMEVEEGLRPKPHVHCKRDTARIWLQYIVLICLLLTTFYSFGLAVFKTGQGDKDEHQVVSQLLTSLTSLQKDVSNIQNFPRVSHRRFRPFDQDQPPLSINKTVDVLKIDIN